MIGGWELPVIVAAGIILFGGSKIRDVARGLGAAKKEFMVGQAEADAAAERARAEAKAAADARAASESKAAESTAGVVTGAGGAATTPPVP